ncbi:MAG TPA: stage II sporulation protein M [Firmicutes bacterium]|jgi:stage II sporulation protein M|nr:stage II sporulation protein M [Bacillota bacterium]
MYRLRQRFFDHIEAHLGLYVFTTLLAAVGIAFGALAVEALGAGQKLELIEYLQGFLGSLELTDNGYNPLAALAFALGMNLKTIAAIWFLGLTVVGAPMVALVVFLRGFLIGFSVGLLVSEMGFSGILIALTAVLPHNLLAVPVLIMAATSAFGFSFQLVQSRLRGERVFYAQFLSYTAVLTCCAFLLCLASLFESYLTPLLVRMAT